jgi:RNA polymerase sigma factor (sigma-70 family)
MRLSHLGDELLARYAARGSERAFAALYERYHQQLYRYCRSILRNDPDAQDALQSTFAGALQALRRNQRNAPLRPWLYRIAHNEAISLVRRRSRDAGDELQADSLGTGASVEQEAADRARWRMLVADLGSLPDRQRGALLLRELSGLSHEEIAIALGTSTAGAKQAIFEARQAMAEIEEGRAMSCEEVRQRISEGDRRVLRGRRVTAHMRECAGCEAFALAIPARRTQLRAMTPVLPPAAAAALLSRSMHASSHATGASGTSAAAASGAIGKATGTALAWKALAGAALIATTAAGVTGLRHLAHHGQPALRSVPAAQLPPTASARADSAITMILARHAADANLLRQGSPSLASDARRGHGNTGHHGKAAAHHGRGHSRSAMHHSRGRSGGRAVRAHRGSDPRAHGSSGHAYASPAHSTTSQTRTHTHSGSSGQTSAITLPLSVPKKPLTIKLPKRRSAVRIHTPSR